MKPLGLNRKNTVWIYCDSLCTLQPFSKFFFIRLFDVVQSAKDRFIINKSTQLFQFKCILFKAVTDHIFDQSRQHGITFQQPASKGDTIGLIIEFFRIQAIEIIQFTVFQNFCMQCGHTVRAVRKMNIHMGHVYCPVSVNDSCSCILCPFRCQLVQPLNNRYKLRNHFFQICHRPFFQSFRKNGVVGVSTNFCNNLNSFFKINPFFFQQANQFRDYHRWMSIIDLDCCIICQIMEIASSFHTFF